MEHDAPVTIEEDPMLATASRLEIAISTYKPFASILTFFRFMHLPHYLRGVSCLYARLAIDTASMASLYPAEQAACLRKLLEAKDCAVRAALV